MPVKVAQTTIARPADDVWAVLGRFDDLAWYEGVECWTVSGDVRTIRMKGMDIEIDERLLHHDDERRTYGYAVSGYRGNTLIGLPDGGTFDLGPTAGHHRASIEVTAIDAAMSLITYTCDIDEGYDTLIAGTTQGYQSRIDAVKRGLEAASG